MSCDAQLFCARVILSCFHPCPSQIHLPLVLSCCSSYGESLRCTRAQRSEALRSMSLRSPRSTRYEHS